MLYPIMTKSRAVLSLDGIWNFKLGGEALDERSVRARMKGGQPMPVPASFNDLDEGEAFRDHYGWVYYERFFTVPDCMCGKRLVLRLDAATHRAKVYLNGVPVAEHVGGFTPFEVELKDLEEGENRLTVAVSTVIDDSTLPVGGEYVGRRADGSAFRIVNPNMDFFNYTGLTRSVRIYSTPRDHIEDIAVVTAIEGENARVSYRVTGTGGAVCRVKVKDEEGNCVAEAAGEEGEIILKNARLWQPGDAYLYSLEVCYGEDVYFEPFGVRTVEVKEGKFLINGKPFYFKGFGKHEDTPVAGRGLNLPFYVKDLNLMKWLGANSLRTSHYPYSEEFLRLCDREGIVVIDECAAVGLHYNLSDSFGIWKPGVNTWEHIRTHENHERALRELVARDKNHPSVVMWSISNEAAESTPGAYEYFSPLFALVRSLDPTRPLTNVSLAGVNAENDLVAPLADVICLNRYYGWYTEQGDLQTARVALAEELRGWQARYPEKPVLFTEFGADSIAGLHDVTPVMFTEEYQRDFLAAYAEVFDAFPQVVGEQVWNFADFYAVQGIKRVQGNRKGVFTRDRKPKLAAHFLRARWRAIPDFGYEKGGKTE